MRYRALPLVLSILLLAPAVPVSATEPEPAPADADLSEVARTPLSADGRWIVLLRDGADARKVRDRHATRNSVKADRLFERAVRGFSGQLNKAQVEALQADPDVAAVVPDEVVEIAAQVVPTGVSRVGARASTSTVAKIDGIDERVNADVAIVDTGIDPKHPDLNVAGGVNCSTSDRSLWRDVQGHGTHVAGTVGAIDNASGVVGVAPGVRLWAVKILNDEGFGYLSWYVCGLDWIAAQKDPADSSRPLFESVNMSVAKWGRNDRTCGAATNDILHAAICRLVASGVTVVAAAGNDAGNAADRVPAAYDEVITVSALADMDGKAGGLGGPLCWSWGGYDKDDTFADFSNYGPIDLIAPGKCIWSSLPGNRYGHSSGTSMAAPAVAGAVALFKASRPWASPVAVRDALQVLGSTNWFTSTDPDGKAERLLYVARLGPAGKFSAALGGSVSVGQAGGTVTFPVTIDRSPTHFETLRLTASTPPGFPVGLDRTRLSGFDAKTATVTVTVPAGMPEGTYQVKLVANEGSRTSTATSQIVVLKDAPTAYAPVVIPAYKSVVLGETAPVRVSWPAAKAGSADVAGYELQYSLDWGGWGWSLSYGATTTSVVRPAAINHSHRFRIRARDTAGNWSPWVISQPLRLGAVDDSATSVRRSTGWSRVDDAQAFRGTLSRTTRTGASWQVTMNARTLAVVAPTGPRQGWFEIYVDGVYQTRITLYAATAESGKVLWAKTFPADTTKVIELRAVRSTARDRADLDAVLIGR